MTPLINNDSPLIAQWQFWLEVIKDDASLMREINYEIAMINCMGSLK